MLGFRHACMEPQCAVTGAQGLRGLGGRGRFIRRIRERNSDIRRKIKISGYVEWGDGEGVRGRTQGEETRSSITGAVRKVAARAPQLGAPSLAGALRRSEIKRYLVWAFDIPLESARVPENDRDSLDPSSWSRKCLLSDRGSGGLRKTGRERRRRRCSNGGDEVLAPA